MLDEILEYKEHPEDDVFVDNVMTGVRRQQFTRKLILMVTGLIGAIFGAMGLLTISRSTGHLFNETNVLPISVALVGLAVFLVWLFQDEVLATG